MTGNHRETGWFMSLQLRKNGSGYTVFPKDLIALLDWKKGDRVWVPPDRFTHRDDGQGETVVGLILEKPPPGTCPKPTQVRNHHGQKQCPSRHWNPVDAKFCTECGKQMPSLEA